jgi:hypothetical protein
MHAVGSAAHWRVPGWQERGLIFCTKYGGMLDQSRVREQWTPACAKAGVPRYRIHDLRHSVASNLIAGGMGLLEVAHFLDSQLAQFPWSVLSRCIDPELPFPGNPQEGHVYSAGYDPAETQDRSGFVVIDTTTHPWQVVECLDLSSLDYPAQKREVASLSQKWNGWEVLMDVTGHASHAQELSDYLTPDGYQTPVRGMRFTYSGKIDLFDNLSRLVEEREIVFPFIENLIHEMKFLRRQQRRSGRLEISAPEQGYDDLTTALALAALAVAGTGDTAQIYWI